MRIDFRNADFEGLTNLWNSYYPPHFAIDSDIFRINTVEAPTFDWGASAIEVCDNEIWGFVLVKKSPNPTLYAGSGEDVSHLSAIAYIEPEIGVDLLGSAKRTLKDRGIQSLMFGMDSRHFFPGCPESAPNLCNFLMVEGFQKLDEYFDLERDLSTYQSPVPPVAGLQFRPATEGDMPTVQAFFAAEFPNRWRYDVLQKIQVDGITNSLFGVFEGGRMLGFALLQDWRHTLPIGGAVWRNSLGEKWGSLGPIGIAKSERGRGLGDALLGSALNSLKNRGVGRCIIDWTVLESFYGKHGFEITRTYKRAKLTISE
jgi:GNAT superfamily N-acetyltransferase